MSRGNLKFVLIFFFSTIAVFYLIYFIKSSNISDESTNNSIDNNTHDTDHKAVKAFPTLPVGRLTKQIWQTARENVKEEIQKDMATWKHVEGWKYNFVTNPDAIKLLTERFPQIDFDKLKEEKAILAFDLWRYVVVYENGGFYADCDVERHADFTDSMDRLKDCNVIVGVEGDLRFQDEWSGWLPRNVQYTNWSLYSAPGHPLLKLTIDRVVRKIMYYQSRGISLKDVDVLEVSGPAIWTDSIIDYVALSSGVRVKEDFMCGPSYKVNDVCILNVKGYALHMEHTCHNEVPEDSLNLVIHHFLGSWKD